MLIVEIISNLAQLIALSVISGFVGKNGKNRSFDLILQGLIFGAASVIGMLQPMTFIPGLIFDGRSVLLSLCGLFFGPLAAFVAGTMALVCRLSQGGIGELMGILVIAASCLWGVFFYYRWTRRNVTLVVWRLWLFGVLVHVTMIACMFGLPSSIRMGVLEKIAWPVLLLYPVATILIGKILSSISERRQAEESLRASENRYRGLVDLAVDGILLGSHDGVIIEANQCLCEILRMPREALIGKHIAELPFSKESIQRTPFRFDLLKEGRTVISERTLNRLDGTELFIEMHTKMMPEGFYQSIIRDVTYRKEAERELEQYRLNLEALVKARTRELEEANAHLVRAQEQFLQVEKMASLGRLAAGIAHEINNPMSYITTNLDVLQRYIVTLTGMLEVYRGLEEQVQALAHPPTQKTLAIIDDLRKEAELDELLADMKKLMAETESGVLRVTKIVSDLRVFARQEKEGMELADLNKRMDCALNIVSSEVRYNTSVVKEYGVLPQVLCYPRQMEQVFINLLVNAVQSIEKKGTIVLRTFCVDENVFIEIQDDGCGIPERDQQRIFDPFFTTKEAGQGTGLGLSIVYNVLQNHQGEVTVKSVVGKGSTFTLRVPVKPVPQK